MPITYTPVRYPGGKSKIYPVMDAIIEENGLAGCTYAEAFCGGAGLAIKLLLRGRVSRIMLNDVDPAVYSMWRAIVSHPQELCGFLSGCELSIGEWSRQREVLLSSGGPSLELGMAALYLNRTNRSGILGARPIGGMSQDGAYDMSARFNRNDLCRKVMAIARRADDIELENADASEYIESTLKGVCGPLLANFDPPYVEKGPGLYENSFAGADHQALAGVISSCRFPWIVTYDAVPLVDEAYARFDRYDLSVGYSAARARVGSEILVAGPGMRVPDGLLARRAA